jgi:hypothetical protein
VSTSPPRASVVSLILSDRSDTPSAPDSATSHKGAPVAAIAGGVIGGLVVFALLLLALVLFRRRRHASEGSWGMVWPGVAGGGPDDAEIRSWRPAQDDRKASFVRVNSTRVRIGNALRFSSATARMSTASSRAPATPTTPMMSGAPGRMASTVPPVPAVPTAFRAGAATPTRVPIPAPEPAQRVSEAPSLTDAEIASWTARPLDPFRDEQAGAALAPISEGGGDARELGNGWAPPTSRVRRKVVPSVDADPFADPTPTATSASVGPPQLTLDFGAPSRLSAVSDNDALVPPGVEAGVAI